MKKFESASEGAVVAPLFYSVSEVAAILGMSAITVYRAIAADEFPAVRVRGRLIVPARAVDSIIEAALVGNSVVDTAAWMKPVDGERA